MTTFSISAPKVIGPTPWRFLATSRRFLALPFDTMRAQYAAAVNLGIVERSILASSRVERTLAMLERYVLGPLARRA